MYVQREESMNSHLLKYVAIAVTISSPVSAATLWEIELINQQGDRVGTGEFSYNPETTDVLSGINPESGEFETFSESNVLESFTLDFMEEEVEFEPSNKWWQTDSSTAMQQLQDTIIGNAISNSWTLLNGSGFPPLFALAGSSTETTAQGTWFFGDSNFISPDSPLAGLIGVNASGTWNASLQDNITEESQNTVATPESSTIFGLLFLAGMGLAVTTRKISY